MNRSALILGAMPALLLWGCGGGSGRNAAPPAATPPAATAAAKAPSRAIDICAAAPDAEVARALGAKVRKPARGSKAMGSECDYDLDFGDGHSGLFFVWAGKPSIYFSRELATGEVEEVPGLGRKAWVQHAMPEDSWDLHVLVEEDVAFEAKGDKKDRVLALGRFLAPKLH